MKRMKLRERSGEKNLKWKLFLLVVLLIIFIINLVVVHTRRSKEREAFQKELETYQENEILEEDTSVPNFGTEDLIVNLKEYAEPLLEKDACLLEESLLNFFCMRT